MEKVDSICHLLINLINTRRCLYCPGLIFLWEEIEYNLVKEVDNGNL